MTNLREFLRHRNETFDRNSFGAPRRIYARGVRELHWLDIERFQALAQHLAALAEGGLSHLFKHAQIARQRRGPGHESDNG